MIGKVKFGITGPVPGESVEGLINYTTLYEKDGFDTVWFPDHVVFMAKTITPEVWSVITAASLKTKNIGMALSATPTGYIPRSFLTLWRR